MKKSNTKSNLGLFGLLVFTLSMSQGWADSLGTVTSRDLASQGEVIRLDDLEAKYKQDGKTVTRTIQVTGQTETVEVIEPIKVNDVWTTTRTPKKRFKVTYSDSECSSGDCITAVEPHVFDDKDDIREIQAMLEAHFKEEIEKNLAAADELKKKRGDLEARKKKADKCLISIVDEDDKEQDINLKDSEYKSERMDCRVAKFNEKYEDESDKKKYNAFRKEFRKELEKMLFSSDDEEREMALSILEDMSGSIDSDRIEDYLTGLEGTQSDYEMLLQDAMILGENPQSWEALEARNRINMALTGYNQREMQYRMGSQQGYKFGTGAQAFLDTKAEMVRRMNIAMTNPNQLIRNSFDSDLDLPMGPSAGRGGRVATGWDSIPRMDFNNSLIDPNGRGRGNVQGQNQNFNRGGNQSYNGGSTFQGHYVPRSQRQTFNPGVPQQNWQQQQGQRQQMPYPPNQAGNYRR